jgi:hypothetical protein
VNLFLCSERLQKSLEKWESEKAYRNRNLTYFLLRGSRNSRK